MAVRNQEKEDRLRFRSTTGANQRRLSRAENQLKRVVEKTAGKGATSAKAQSVAADAGNARLVRKIQKKESKAAFQAKKAGSDPSKKKTIKTPEVNLPKIKLPKIKLTKLKPGGGKPNYSKSVGNPNLTLGDKLRGKCKDIACRNEAKKGKSGQWSQ